MALPLSDRPNRLRSLLLCALLAVGGVGEAFGQGATLERSIVSASGSLSSAQSARLASFIGQHAAVLRDSTDARRIEDARNALINPARDPAATIAFRKSYAAALVPELAEAVNGRDLRRALQAMQVLRFTRSPEGLDLIIARTDSKAESNAGKRLAAGSLVADAFEDLDANNAYYESAARRLRDACAGESDWIALQQKLQSIGAAARRRDLPSDTVRSIRRSQTEAIAELARSMKAAKAADPRMQSLQRALVTLRNDLLLMPTADRSAMAKVLAPALADVVATGVAHWDSAHADAALSQSYAATLNSCETLLRLIDRSERPEAYAGTQPDADGRVLTPSWEAKEKAAFEAESKRWSGIVAAAPYKL
jgi:hypothetical protein